METEYKTFEEAIEACRAAHIQVNGRSNTRRDYNALLSRYLTPYFGETKVRFITPEAVERWRKAMLDHGAGIRTVKKARTRSSVIACRCSQVVEVG